MFFLALLDTVQRRLSDEQVRLLNQRGHVAVEEREQKSTYVRAVDLGIGNDYHAVIAEPGMVDFGAACPQGGDQGANLLMAQHLLRAGFLYIQYLAF